VIRLVLFVLFASAILAALLNISVWFFFIPLGGFFVYAYTFGGLKLRCPYCRKRIKLGARACHHCGRIAAPG
jgi:hypothetical protein